ncbi:ribonuclease t2 [Lynx pardinus]|uniref:Ribonuclease t2 n=1 Tax=Lynx pardinus TaxID=191816 RepID=A0A485N600_LYNPA|nr:ribonuclease t2 [Lynx pardinus]
MCRVGGASSDNHEWKKLIMVHHWPVTVCKEVGKDCRDPPDYWTIHGLWPDKAEECNRSWHFNFQEIKDLLPEMKMYWPDVLHPLNHSHFWQHEWEKHGTCAAQVDTLNSQKRYFGGGLDLYQKLALNSMLQKLGIKPSINYYQTPEEDLNLDSEPIVQDTVEEGKCDSALPGTKSAASLEDARLVLRRGRGGRLPFGFGAGGEPPGVGEGRPHALGSGDPAPRSCRHLPSWVRGRCALRCAVMRPCSRGPPRALSWERSAVCEAGACCSELGGLRGHHALYL